jgi:hypothetical protein
MGLTAVLPNGPEAFSGPGLARLDRSDLARRRAGRSWLVCVVV